MQMGFLSVNSALAAKSGSLEKTENALNLLYYKLIGKSDIPAKVNYPNSFDVLSLMEAITTTFQIVERNISTRLNKELLKKLSRKAMPVISEDTKLEVEDEIEKGDGTIEKLMTGLNPYEQTQGDPAAKEVDKKQENLNPKNKKK
jgi:hypothetical protein